MEKVCQLLHRLANYPRFLTILVRGSYALVVRMPRAMVGSTMGIIVFARGQICPFFLLVICFGESQGHIVGKKNELWAIPRQ